MALAEDTTLNAPLAEAQSLKRPLDAMKPLSTSMHSNFPIVRKPISSNIAITSILSQRRSALHHLHQKFAEDMGHERKIRFDTEDLKADTTETPAKKRRFQRRNSKTAAMLSSSLAAIVSADLEAPESDDSPDNRESSPTCPWDGGLQIAEELVRQLKLRRQSMNQSAA